MENTGQYVRKTTGNDYQNVIGMASREPIVSAHDTCWYCDKELNNVRRFCDNHCAEAFEEDDMAMTRRLLASRHFSLNR